MNIFKKFYCRTFQFVFKLALPFLPYREPTLLKSNQELADVLKQKNISSVLIVTDKGISGLKLTKQLEQTLLKNNINYAIYDETVPNPTDKNVDDAAEIYRKNNCNAIIGFGGGSPMDCAKATGAKIVYPNKPLSKMKGVMKVRKSLPLLIAIPTTAGTGSETTLAAVITDSKTRHKYAINSFPLIPNFALLDENLTLNLPKSITATTGMDALTHAIEAYIGRSTTKQTRAKSLSAIKLIFENLVTAYNDGNNKIARKNMLIAAFDAGVAFTKSYVGYVHAIAHSLGGKYNTPHGLANAIILPKMLRFYGKAIHKKLWKIAVSINLISKNISIDDGAEIFISEIEKLNTQLNIPSSLPEINEKDISRLAQTAEYEANPLYPVPKLFEAKDLEKIYYQIMQN